MTGGSSARRLLIGVAGCDEVSVSAGRVTTVALVAGNGPPLVLLHGVTPVGGLVWWPVIKDLSTSHTVIVPDLPGLGESEGLNDPLRPELVVTWLGDVVDALCKGPATLVATSLGASFALRLALVRPERLRRLVVVGAAGFAPFRPPPGFILGTFLNTMKPSHQTLERLVPYVVHDREQVTQLHGRAWNDFFEYSVSQSRRPTVRQALRRYTSRPNSRPLPDSLLAQIPVQVELIWGEHDRPFPLSIAESVSTRYGWPLQIIEAAGHLPYIERPSDFIEILLHAS